MFSVAILSPRFRFQLVQKFAGRKFIQPFAKMFVPRVSQMWAEALFQNRMPAFNQKAAAPVPMFVKRSSRLFVPTFLKSSALHITLIAR